MAAPRKIIQIETAETDIGTKVFALRDDGAIFVCGLDRSQTNWQRLLDPPLLPQEDTKVKKVLTQAEYTAAVKAAAPPAPPPPPAPVLSPFEDNDVIVP